MPEVGGTGRVLRPTMSKRPPAPRDPTMADREGAYCMFPEYPAVLASGETTGAWPANVPVLLRAPSIWERDLDMDPTLPWFHNSVHAIRELAPAEGRGNHGVGMANMRALPSLLANPIAIWISRAEGSSTRRCAMLDARDDRGVPLVAVVDTKGFDDELKVPCVHIVTIFGKEGFVSNLKSAAEGGDVIYIDMDRFEDVLSNSPMSNMVAEATSRLAAFACVPAVPPRDLAANLRVRGIDELASMRNTFSGAEPHVDMDALLATMPKSVSVVASRGSSDHRGRDVAPSARMTARRSDAGDAKGAPLLSQGGDVTANPNPPKPDSAEDAIADEEEFMAEVGRAVARARGYIDDWFYTHRYDRIDGDVDDFLNRAAGGVIACMVASGGSIEDVVDGVVRDMLG